MAYTPIGPTLARVRSCPAHRTDRERHVQDCSAAAGRPAPCGRQGGADMWGLV